MYVVCLLFYAIGGFLFVSIFILFLCSFISEEATDCYHFYFSPLPKHSPVLGL